MSDIVERLRVFADFEDVAEFQMKASPCREAANEIERLRAEKTELVEALEAANRAFSRLTESRAGPLYVQDANRRVRTALSRARETGGEADDP